MAMESLKFAGIDCRRTKPGEEGGIYYKDADGSIKRLDPTFQELFPGLKFEERG